VYTCDETEQTSDFSKCDTNHNHDEEKNLSRQEVNNACKRKPLTDCLKDFQKPLVQRFPRVTEEMNLQQWTMHLQDAAYTLLMPG
jgi:hypothetical protein